jgi:hypothetical protein
MSKHTPGPWTECAAHTSFGGDKLSPDENYRHIEGGRITSNQDTGFYITGFIKPADARLAAAAPELLEALEACEMRLTHLAQDGANVTHTLKFARAAIAKATGEQS